MHIKIANYPQSSYKLVEEDPNEGNVEVWRFSLRLMFAVVSAKTEYAAISLV